MTARREIYVLYGTHCTYIMILLLQGTGQFINTKFFCRVCALLHDPKVSNKGGDLSSDAQYYEDINKWWRGPGTCINGSWRKFSQALKAKENKRVPKVTDTPAEQEDKEAKLP